MQEADPDVALMLAFQAGDDSTFDGLYHRWAGPLLRYLERMVGDTATAEELLQDAFLRVHRARARYEPRARFSTFLYRIATNLALNELKRPRRRHRHAEEQEQAIPDPRPDAEDQLDVRLRRERVEQWLDQLPERQRVALWLSAVEGCSYAEVARVLETTEKSVKALVHRGRCALVAKMNEAAEVHLDGPLLSAVSESI